MSTSCSVWPRKKPLSVLPSLKATSATAHWKSGQKAQKGQTAKVATPMREVGLSSQALISFKVERAPTADRSGPLLPPRPLTMWQLPQPPAPKKNVSPAATCSGGETCRAESFIDFSHSEMRVTCSCGRDEKAGMPPGK